MLRAGSCTVSIDRWGRHPGDQYIACCAFGRGAGWGVARLRPDEATRVMIGVSSWLSDSLCNI